MPISYPQSVGIVNFRIRVTEKKVGRTINELIKTFEGKIPTYQKLTLTKKRVLDHLQMYINAHRQRPSETHDMKSEDRFKAKNNLYNCIEKSTKIISEGNTHRLYIGEKTFLNTFAPYWYVLNYGNKYGGGRFVPPPTVGYFGRGRGPSAVRGEVFHHAPYSGRKGKYGGDRTYYIKPQTFTPMYYLNEMAKVFAVEMQLLANQVKQK